MLHNYCYGFYMIAQHARTLAYGHVEDLGFKMLL